MVSVMRVDDVRSMDFNRDRFLVLSCGEIATGGQSFLNFRFGQRQRP
jgi:hypothetical protein